MIAGNPGAATFFYVPWLAMNDKNDPTRWVAYERAAFHIWQCMVTRINQDLAADGRGDRIATIPANLALAYLAAQLQQGSRLPGLEAAGLRASMDGLFSDTVHLTPLGSYYMAVITYMGMSGLPPGRPASEQERFLAGMAGRFLESRAHETRAMRVADCQRFLRASFLDDYLSYSRRSWWSSLRLRREISAVSLSK
jgi:hypothetical protein